MSLTYSDYLHLDRILSSQHEKSSPPEHDELLFIIIHQAYELWFKQELHEAALLGKRLDDGDTFGAIRTMRRMLVILKTLVQQTDILETMTPLGFSRFRDRLETASGFQSYQFREFEFVCGQKDRRRLNMFQGMPAVIERLERRIAEPTLWDHFARCVAARGHAVPAEVLERDVTQPVVACEPMQDLLYDVYRRDKEIALLVELMVDLDEGFQEFRYRHVKMVERTIGDKAGTGGSSGVDYLRSTLFTPFFPDLWRFRSRL